MAKLLTIVFVVLAAGLFHEGNALKCWRCSSDSSSTAFCNDPFDESLITNQNRQWYYIDCQPPTLPFNSPPQRGVCKKIKQYLNNKWNIVRSCQFEDYNSISNRDSCSNELSTNPTVQFCETCAYDGCNSAGSFTPVAILVAVSAALAKLLSL